MAKFQFEDGGGSLADELSHDLKRDEGLKQAVARDMHEVMEQAKRAAEARLRSYGNSHDYKVGGVIESGRITPIESASGAATEPTITLEWTHHATEFFDKGTEPRVIEGDPLAFEWPDAPPEIQSQFESSFPTVFFQKVHVSAIPAARFTEVAKREAKTATARAGREK